MKPGTLANPTTLFRAKALLTRTALRPRRLRTLFGHVLLMREWLFVTKASVLETIILPVACIRCSPTFPLHPLDIMCTNVMWLWRPGLTPVRTPNMKLANPLLSVLMAWALARCGTGVGVYLIRLLSTRLILKPFSVALKNIGATLFVRNSLPLNLPDVFPISLSLLCSRRVRLLLIVVLRLGPPSFPITWILRTARFPLSRQRQALLPQRRQMFPNSPL